jgi:hypothetical protein
MSVSVEGAGEDGPDLAGSAWQHDAHR